MYCSIALLLALSSLARPASSANFEPYSLNGGLVTAVAGRDFVIVASDTRLTDGGYQIYSRRYLGGRVWAASGPSVLHSGLDRNGGAGDDEAEGVELFSQDGSLIIPDSESDLPVVCDNFFLEAPAQMRRKPVADIYGLTLVGSAGCASDCEALKRTMRAELSDRSGWSSSSSFGCLSSSSSSVAVATLLLHALYARRPFPYYAFCVLAGLDSETGSGRVHVFDAIGSHERVAVACAGTPGREMLQPVLDRIFASSTVGGEGIVASVSSNGEISNGGASSLVRDGTAVGASRQRVHGSSLMLRPPVGTCVGCGPEEAVALLVGAYRSVSEREIGVGDDLVVCIVRRDRGLVEGTPGRGSVEVMRFPLKKH